ncbi:MAG: nucleotide exchange factor GrpE [Desulfamplus sp.]|nr:nucleotide exchange factor GrpE [Desulfamplus sp.]
MESHPKLLDRVKMFISKIVMFIKNFVSATILFLNQKVFTPLKNIFFTLIRFIKEKLSFKKSDQRAPEISVPQTPITETAWKVTALEDFKKWLSEIPSEDPPALTATPDTCDLYTMLSEFIALRQEIKIQTKEQNRTINALNSVKGVTDEYGEIYTLFKEKTNQIAQLEQNIRMSSEKKSASCFFDVRDALERGYRESVEMANRTGFFRRPPKDIHKICEGYEMAITNFDKALSIMDIEPIQSDKMPFNPETMKIVETRDIIGIENGTVVETLSGGFVRGREVLRFAKVIIAQSPLPSVAESPAAE